MEELLLGLTQALNTERAKNARFRRVVEDLLYNLEEENMPNVAAKLRATARALSRITEEDGGEELVLRPEAVRAALNRALVAEDRSLSLDADGLTLLYKSGPREDTARLSAALLRFPAVYRNVAKKGDDMLPLYINTDGSIFAVVE